MYRLSLLLACAGVALAQFQCTEDGFYVDPNQCDKYYDCYRGSTVEKLCPDGLVFDYTLGPKVEQCNYPFLVDCPETKSLQPAQPYGIECPRRNGYFEHEDPSNCMDYYECTGGQFVLRSCAAGLVFDEFSGACVWEAANVRSGCLEPAALVLENGFHCNQTARLAANGHQLIHTRFVDLDDCRSFYVCLDGKRPTKQGCPIETVFDDISLECKPAEQVAGCECYYYPPNECPFEGNNLGPAQ
ncbi:unnamed protein product [Meganyctiphanes norvegica]|uniref:Chitin-binding type-2 domain-containing protein n=1 Tax=Meganyctiphanes norvegica TaxID=48144 RepID=A0AAV2RLN8_MEGNR